MKTELGCSIPKLKRLIPKFRKVHVAVLGDLMLDRYLWGTAHRLSPEAAVPVVDFVSQNDCLGGAGNVAANLAALGAQVQIFGVVGGRMLSSEKIADDEAGAALRACLRGAKIGDRGVLADPKRITTVKVRVVARHQQIVRIDHERRDPLTPETEEKLFRLMVAALKTTDALVLSDYDKGLITDAFTERILHACHKFKVPVFVKPKTSRLFAYRGARAVVCNKKEAGFYVTQPLDDEKSVEEAGRQLLARFGSSALVITRGEKGMSVFEESTPKYLNIPATSSELTYARVGKPGLEREAGGRQILDLTGAGDTVLSVLSLTVAAGAKLTEAAYLANTAAGVVVGKLGTESVSPAELAAAMGEIHYK
jgi:D-beta-D-heptose 7-phosphate kinase / D-beta-D-heptose 1-phosphate adenosyltransferase